MRSSTFLPYEVQADRKTFMVFRIFLLDNAVVVINTPARHHIALEQMRVLEESIEGKVSSPGVP